jgi:hypothetical protein
VQRAIDPHAERRMLGLQRSPRGHRSPSMVITTSSLGPGVPEIKQEIDSAPPVLGSLPLGVRFKRGQAENRGNMRVRFGPAHIPD